MSVYNGEKYLTQAIDSILNQIFSNFEFIIINDNSSDKTKEILNTYSDKRIKIIKNAINLGLTKSLNKGLAKSKGEYIARMDCDDISMPDRFEIQNKFLDENPQIACVGGKTIIIDDNGKINGEKNVETNPDVLAFKMLMINQIAHSSIMIRADVIKRENYYNEDYRYTQDYELWSRLIASGYNITNIDIPLIKYRYHNSSITQNKESKNNAYELVIKTTRNNLNKYINLSDKQLLIYTQFFHKYHVNKIFNLLVLEWLIFKLTKSYTDKVDAAKSFLIWNCARAQMYRAFKCYLVNLIKK